MARSSFSVNNSSAVATTFTLVEQTGRDAGYQALALGGPGTPCLVNMKHTMRPLGASGVDRHLYQAILVKEDTEGVKHTMKVNLTVEIPRTDAFAASDVKDLRAFVFNDVTPSNFDILCAGANP